MISWVYFLGILNTMKTLIFIRHAESQANVNRHLIGGRVNHVPLTERGVRQSRALGRHFVQAQVTPHIIYRSPAVRTRQTAEISLHEAGIEVPVHVHDSLQEMGQGRFEGMLRDEVYTPEVITDMYQIGKSAKLPDDDAESMTEVGERMYQATFEIADALRDGELALIYGHGLAIRCLASHIEDWSRLKTFETETDNTSRTCIVQHLDGTFAVEYVGRTDHMIDDSSPGLV